MSVCYYSADRSSRSRELYNRLCRLRPRDDKHLVRWISALTAGPGQGIGVGDTVVLFAGSAGELDAIIEKRDLLADCRVILVVPDSGEETIHKAYMLRPRFVDFMDSDKTLLVKVLRNVLAREGN